MYFLHVTLDAQYTDENISHILNNFSEYGCVFLAKEEDRDLVQGSYFLTPEQAATKILTATEEVKAAFENNLLLKYKDTHFDFRFYIEKNNLVSISLFDFPRSWGKEFRYSQRDFFIDFARYINLTIDITKEFSLINLEILSDESDLLPKNILNNCVAAVVDLGLILDVASGKIVDLGGSIENIIMNIKGNNIVLLNEVLIEFSYQKLKEIFKAGFPVGFYAKKDSILFKVEIKPNDEGYKLISLYPLEPYRMKKGYGSEDEKIDVAFYTQRLIELCENFAIYELKTFI